MQRALPPDRPGQDHGQRRPGRTSRTPATTRASSPYGQPRLRSRPLGDRVDQGLPEHPGERTGSAGAPVASAAGPGTRRGAAVSALIVPDGEGPVAVGQQHALRQSRPPAGPAPRGSGRAAASARPTEPDASKTSASRVPQPTIRSADSVSRRYPGSRAVTWPAASSRTVALSVASTSRSASGATSVNVPKKGRSQRRSPGGRVQPVRGLVLQHDQGAADEPCRPCPPAPRSTGAARSPRPGP